MDNVALNRMGTDVKEMRNFDVAGTFGEQTEHPMVSQRDFDVAVGDGQPLCRLLQGAYQPVQGTF